MIRQQQNGIQVTKNYYLYLFLYNKKKMLYFTLIVAIILTIIIMSFEPNEHFESITTKVAIVSMVTKQPNFDYWLNYHLKSVGIDKIYLRIENAPDIVLLINNNNKIYKEIISDELPKENNYFGQMDRQQEFVNRMIQKASEDQIDFLFHIDADELISVNPQNLRHILNSCGNDVACIHMQNFEAVYDPSETNNCFHAVKYLDCRQDACTSYANGKSIAVIKNNPTFHGPHYFSGGGTYEMPPDLIKILHHDSCTFDAWQDKFKRMTKTSDISAIPFPFYRESIDLHQRNASHEEKLKYYQKAKCGQ